MWHAYNLISVRDVLKSTTIRLVLFCNQFVYQLSHFVTQTVYVFLMKSLPSFMYSS